MKSILRRSVTAGLALGSAVVGTLWMGAIAASALTPEQIKAKLGPVPMFTIADGEGAPLVAAPSKGQQGRPMAGVFVSRQDAQAFLDKLKTGNAKLASQVKIVPVSLAEIYQLSKSNQGKADSLDFAYVPSEQQINYALQLLKAEKGTEQFQAVLQQRRVTPLFVARAGEKKGYLTIQQDKNAFIPMFFKKEDLQVMLERFKQQQPNLASTIEIQVLSLEGLMANMDKNDPKLDQQLSQVILVPPRESIEFIQSTQKQAPKK